MHESEARELLTVAASVSYPELKAAYRGALKRWHPDLLPSDSPSGAEAIRRTQLINEAYRVLRSERGSKDGGSVRPGEDQAPTWDGKASWVSDHRFEIKLVIGCILLIAVSAIMGQVLSTL